MATPANITLPNACGRQPGVRPTPCVRVVAPPLRFDAVQPRPHLGEAARHGKHTRKHVCSGKKILAGLSAVEATGSGQRDCQGPWEAWHEAHSLYRVVLGTSRVHLDADTARAAAILSAANGSFTSVSRGVQTTAHVCDGARGRVSWARRAVDGSDEAERATARHHGLIQGYSTPEAVAAAAE